MSDFDHLKERLNRGYISRRNFVRSAIALGVASATAISFARSGQAARGAKFGEAREGFPVTGRPDLRHPGLDNQVWNRTDHADMFNYTVSLINSAIKDADAAGETHLIEDAWLGYVCSLAASESWAFDQAKNPQQFDWASKNTLDQNATKLVEDATNNSKDKADQAQARWALAIVNMNFGRTSDAVTEYENIRSNLVDALPREEVDDFNFEMSDAYVHAGRVTDALDLIQRGNGGNPIVAKRDWHHHQRAWCFFVRAGRHKDPAARHADYDIALAVIGNQQNTQGTTRHLALTDLLAAACYSGKAILFAANGQTEAADLMDQSAKRRVLLFRATNSNFKGWSLTNARYYAPFNAGSDDANHWEQTLTRAGL